MSVIESARRLLFTPLKHPVRTMAIMTIRERSSGEVAVLEIEGALSASDASRALGTAIQALLLSGRNRVILNLEHVPYVDSAGLSDMIEGFHATHRAGGSLKVAHPSKRVRELLEITRLLTILEVFDSEAEALASLTPRSDREPCRIAVEGLDDPVMASQLQRAVGAGLSDVALRSAWTVRVAPGSVDAGEWVLTINRVDAHDNNADAHDDASLARERETLYRAAKDVIRTFPLRTAALNASSPIT